MKLLFTLIAFCTILLFNGCNKKENITAETLGFTNYTKGTVVCTGNIIGLNNKNKITQKGICWSTYNKPSLNVNSSTVISNGDDHLFSVTLTGLVVGKSYYARAYAITKQGETIYGSEESFVVPDAPEVTTNLPYLINETGFSAAGSFVGTIQNLQNYITGICWSNNPAPTTSNSFSTAPINNGTTFSVTITGLTADTKYYYRSYVIFDSETYYGNEQTVTTLGTVTDYDGNIYLTTTIGSQVWMTSNLRVKHFRNGNSVPYYTNSNWPYNTVLPAYGFYNNNASNQVKIGALYNLYTVIDTRGIAPQGWHVPTNNDWNILENYVGTYEGGTLKSDDLNFWTNNNYHTNSTGFSALGGGSRNVPYSDVGLGESAYFWSNTPTYYSGTLYLPSMNFSYGSYNLSQGSGSSSNGFSIRCVKD